MSKPIIPYFQDDIEKLARLRKRPGAGGDNGTENGLLQKPKGLMDKLENNEAGINDILPDFVPQTIGRWFTNAKIPSGYENAVKPENFVQSGLNLLQGKDERLWEDDIPVNPVDGMPPGNIFKPKDEYDIRDYFNGRAFGLDDKRSGRGKTLPELGVTDLGNNNYELNRDTETGKTFYKKFDPQAEKWAFEQVFKKQFNKGAPIEDNETIPNSRFTMPFPVMGNVSKQNVNFAGEGEDEGGYYNMVRLNDIWDYKLNPGEKIDSPTNLGRNMLDQVMNPVNVTGTSKVYIPNIKKQPRRKKVSGGHIMDADII